MLDLITSLLYDSVTIASGIVLAWLAITGVGAFCADDSPTDRQGD